MSTMSLQELRAGLVARHERELAQADAVIAMASGLNGQPPEQPRIEQKATKRTERGPERHKGHGGVETRTLKVLERAVGLPARFRASDIERVMGIANGHGTVSRWLTQGLIVRSADDGTCERSAKWRAAVEGAVESVRRNTDREGALKEQLGRAIATRDAAQARGQTDVARAAQQDINRLEKELGDK